uniref:IF rod domain-containing protein n=1 Tax=Loa loa TaxID=7209 RepID=A0A1I7W3Q3_LOALO
MSDSSTLRSSPTRTHRSSRLSTIGSEANDKKRSIRGRRSSMSVKEVIDGVEITKDVIIGDDISKVNEKNSSLLSIKMAAIEEEEKHLMNYIKKLQNEKEEWDKMLQNYEKSVISQNQKLKAEIVTAELNYENKDELLAQKAECDAVLFQIENWAAKHGFSERLTVI